MTNSSLSDYAIPVSADVPDLEVVFVGEPDPASLVGSKGLGEVGVSAIAPAIGECGVQRHRTPLPFPAYHPRPRALGAVTPTSDG